MMVMMMIIIVPLSISGTCLKLRRHLVFLNSENTELSIFQCMCILTTYFNNLSSSACLYRMSNSGFTPSENEMALKSNEMFVFAQDRVGYCVETLPSLPVYLYSEHVSTSHHAAEDKYCERVQLQYHFKDTVTRPSSYY